jgi:DNA-binding NarL/FixJ family response regulator
MDFHAAGIRHNDCNVSDQIRVLFAQGPQLVRDLLTHAISVEPDMHLLQEPPVPDTSAGASNPAPDVVIVGTSGLEDHLAVTSALRQWPRSQVLLVTVDGRHSALYRLEPQRTLLGELSPRELVTRIRSAARRVAGDSPSPRP